MVRGGDGDTRAGGSGAQRQEDMMVIDADVISVETACPVCGHEYTALFVDHELTQLRATIAEQDNRLSKMADEFSVASICEALGIDDNDDRTPSQIVNAAADLLTQQADHIAEQAQQLEQARIVICAYCALHLGPAGYCSYPITEQHEMADAWLAANAPNQPALLTEDGTFTDWPTVDEMPREQPNPKEASRE